MRRIRLILLALLLLFTACAAAEADSAYEIAMQMTKAIPEMQEVREMPLENGRENRAVWVDARTGRSCDLVVYAQRAEAIDAAILKSTRGTAVRDVENCALGLDSSLGTDAIWAYRMALAEILDVEMQAGDPDYMLNVNTRKFHLPACSSVDQIKESNRQEYHIEYYGERDALLERGYAACKKCNP